MYVAPTRNNENINYWTTFQTTNPCSADDYRVPNLRELLIFMTRKGEELKEYWKTKYGHEGWFGGWNSWLPSTIHICSYTLFSMNDFPLIVTTVTDIAIMPATVPWGPQTIRVIPVV